MMRKIMIAALLCCSALLPAQKLIRTIPVAAGLPIVPADMDNDGFVDIMTNLYAPRWQHNLGDTAFQWENTNIWWDSSWGSTFDLADFDGDSDLDLLYSGGGPGGLRTTIVGMYQGQLLTSGVALGTTPIENGVLKWIDFDRDGDLDVFVAGYDGKNHVAGLWENQNHLYQPSSSTFPAYCFPSAVFFDLENDGDLDLAYSGCRPTAPYGVTTEVYRNDNNLYVKATNISLPGMSYPCLESADLNNDGRADLILGGSRSGTPVPNSPAVMIYLNNGNSGFDLKQSVPVTNGFSHMAIADIDNNGTRDILLADSSRMITQIAGGTWKLLSNAINTGRSFTLNLADFDHDQKLDFLVYTDDHPVASTERLEIYTNTFPNASKPPKPPANATYEVQDGVVRFNWTASLDDHTPSLSMRYNVRIGTAPGLGNVVACDSDSSGRRLLWSQGNVPSGRTFVLRNLPNGQYWFSVQAIDGHLIGSTFKTIPFTVAPTLAAPTPILPKQGAQDVPVFARAQWVGVPNAEQYEVQAATDVLFQNIVYEDFTTDFYDTLALPDCEANYFWRVRGLATGYLSTWSAVFSLRTIEAFSPVWGVDLPAGYQAEHVKFVHLNQDKRIDLAVLASIEGDLQQFYMAVFCFVGKADGVFELVWQSDVYGQSRGSDTERALLSWLDRDYDGDFDFYWTGLRYQPSRFFKNDGSGKFEWVSAFDLPEARGEIPWFDADNDNDLDCFLPGHCEANILLPAGPNTGDYVTHPLSYGNCGDARIQPFDFDNDGRQDLFMTGAVIWTALARNDGSLNFPLVQGTNFQWSKAGDTEIADIDNDGDMDLIVAGFSQGDWSVWVYENASGYFLLKQTIADPTFMEVALADIDLDGDPDLVLASWNHVSKAYKNTGGQFAPFFATSFTGTGLDLADVDGDGDADMACAAAGGVAILRNNEGKNMDFPPNAHIPGPPEMLSATATGNNVVLSFRANKNRGLNSKATAFNLRVGTTPGGGQIVSPLANLATGQTYLPTPGNIGTTTTWRLKSLASGTYYWSVQSIAADLLGSPFAAEQRFTVGAVPTVETNAPAQLHLFPNPASTEIFVPWPAQTSATDGLVRILDALGRVLREVPVHPDKDLIQKIPVQDLPANLYFLQAVAGGRVVAVGKFVKT